MQLGRKLTLLARFARLYSIIAIGSGAILACSSNPDAEKTSTAHEKLCCGGCNCDDYNPSPPPDPPPDWPPSPFPDPDPDPPPPDPGGGGGGGGGPRGDGPGGYGRQVEVCQFSIEITNLEFGTLCGGHGHVAGTALMCFSRDPDGITRPEVYDAAADCVELGGVQIVGEGPGIYTPGACCNH
jgi:hypothetical protein